jgi:hypothetical protein
MQQRASPPHRPQRQTRGQTRERYGHRIVPQVDLVLPRQERAKEPRGDRSNPGDGLDDGYMGYPGMDLDGMQVCHRAAHTMVHSLTHRVQDSVVERTVAFACPQAAPQVQDGAGRVADELAVAMAFARPRAVPQIQDTDQDRSGVGHAVEERVLALVLEAAPQKQGKRWGLLAIDECRPS